MPLATRAWSYVLLLLVAAGLILSGSVGALIAAAAATVVWLALQRTSMHALLALATLAACVVALVTLQSIRGAPDPLDRLESVTTSTSRQRRNGTRITTSASAHTESAIARIKEDPFVGVGLDLFSVTRPFGVEAYEYDVHNLVIGLWYKTGLVGARRNADRIACDSAIRMDRHLRSRSPQRIGRSPSRSRARLLRSSSLR